MGRCSCNSWCEVIFPSSFSSFLSSLPPDLTLFSSWSECSDQEFIILNAPSLVPQRASLVLVGQQKQPISSSAKTLMASATVAQPRNLSTILLKIMVRNTPLVTPLDACLTSPSERSRTQRMDSHLVSPFVSTRTLALRILSTSQPSF
jgi:hypothetical protein